MNTFLNRIRWFLRSRPFTLTPFGIAYDLITFAVGLAAIATGNNLLFLILGILLGLVLVSGVLSESSLFGVYDTWTSLGSLEAGRPGTLLLTAHKRWRLPTYFLYAEMKWANADGPPPLFFWRITRALPATVPVFVTPRRRGWVALEWIRYSTRYPFGMYDKAYRFARKDRWLATPKIIPLPIERFESLSAFLQEQPLSRRGMGTTPLDIREYRSGDPGKWIHWKQSAKQSQLMVKQMEEERSLCREAAVPEWPREAIESGDAADSLMSFIASLLSALSERGFRTGLQTPDAVFPAPQDARVSKEILEYLAVVEPSETGRLPLSALQIDTVSLWRSAIQTGAWHG